MYQLGDTDEEIIKLVKGITPSTSDKLSPAGLLIETMPKAQQVKAKTIAKTVANSIDILILGPALIYSGSGRKLPKFLGNLLILTGMGTIMVNVGNILEEAKPNKDT